STPLAPLPTSDRMPQFVPLLPPATGRPPSGFRATEPSRYPRNLQRVSASATLRPAPHRSAAALPPPPSLARSPQPGPAAQSSPPATLRPSPLRPSTLRPSTLGPRFVGLGFQALRIVCFRHRARRGRLAIGHGFARLRFKLLIALVFCHFLFRGLPNRARNR